MQTEAPNFNGSYPLAGEKIGPAWRLLWERLSATEWISGNNLVHPVAGWTGLQVETLKNLLRAARSAGILEVRYAAPPGWKQRVAFYRVIS